MDIRCETKQEMKTNN